jgi:putative methionine-R-sulfoxide reductase with GAF domain/membrane protein implicated in regulation of membrane protease activity
MAEEIGKGKNSLIHEISDKIRLSLSIIIFVIFTLFAVIIKYLFAPFSPYLSFIPDVSITLIIGIVFVLSVVGMYLSARMSKQVVRMASDYSSRLERLLSVTKDLREEVHGDILLEKIMDHALSITKSKTGSLLLLDHDTLTFKIIRGERSDNLVGRTIEKGKGIAGWVAENGVPVRVADVSRDIRFGPDIDAITGFAAKSILCVPLKAKSSVVGVLELLNSEGGYPYRERDEEVITYLAEQAAISILKTKFYEDQKNYEIHLTDILLETIDFHIPEKRGHSRRVARYGNVIAKGLNMPDTGKKRLYFACLLHDVGFLKIPSNISFKKEEFMKHPVVGYEMIKPINFYAEIAPFILYHHERYDGYGYPSQLKGKEIPLEARIISIAEAFDAMVSATSYKVPVSYQEALAELRRKAGTQFDPELVELFITNADPRLMQT